MKLFISLEEGVEFEMYDELPDWFKAVEETRPADRRTQAVEVPEALIEKYNEAKKQFDLVKRLINNVAEMQGVTIKW